jgi:hypothetical protein
MIQLILTLTFFGLDNTVNTVLTLTFFDVDDADFELRLDEDLVQFEQLLRGIRQLAWKS